MSSNAKSESSGMSSCRLSFRAMNTDVGVLFECRREQIEPLKKRVRDWFEYAESRFSRFRHDSELSRLNRSSGQLCIVSEAMLEVLELAEQYRARTNGIFDPFVLQALEECGYDVSFDKVVRRGGAPGRDRLSGLSGSVRPGSPNGQDGPTGAEWERMPCLQVDPVMKSVIMPQQVTIDLGGIVKSWAVERLAGWMERQWGVPYGMINAGGDLKIWGGPETAAECWRIGIENPWQIGDDYGCLTIGTGGAVATSGRMRRQWMTDKGTMHHLIDPRSMFPSGSDTIQCTVVGEDLIDCEIWAKVICILGSGDGLSMFRERGRGYEAMLFTDDSGIRFFGNPDSLRARWQHFRADHVHECPGAG